MVFRLGLHATLFSFCLVQGVLSSLAYTHSQHVKILVFCIASFVVALNEIFVVAILSCFGSVSSLLLLPVCTVVYIFFLASTLVVLVAASTVMKSPVSYQSLFAPAFLDGNFMAIVLCLALLSVFLIGALVPLEMPPSSAAGENDDLLFAPYGEKSAFMDSKAIANCNAQYRMSVDQRHRQTLALPDLTPMSMQPEFRPKTLDQLDHRDTSESDLCSGVKGFVHNPSPPVAFSSAAHDYVNTPRDSFQVFKPGQYDLHDKPLKNKDSEKTLTEYDASEELSVDLLVRASMACVDLYDQDIDNWMNLKSESAHYLKPALSASSEIPKDNTFHLAGALKIKKLRGKKSFNHPKTESLPTLQETSSNNAESANRHHQYRITNKLPSEDQQPDQLNPLPLSKSQPYLAGRMGTKVESDQITGRSSDSESCMNGKLRKSDSLPLPIFHSPVRPNFNVFQSSNALKEFCSTSPEKCAMSSGALKYLSPDEHLHPLNETILQTPKGGDSSFVEELDFSKALQESPASTKFVGGSRDPGITTGGHSPYSFESDMEDIEEITRAVTNWNVPPQPQSSIRNVSLEYWEANKDNWISGPQQSRPLVYTSSTIDAHHAASLPANESSASLKDLLSPKTLENKNEMAQDEKLTRSISAPSLHTYREVHDVQSKKSGSTFSLLENTLYRPRTPPAHESYKVAYPLTYHGSQRSLGKNQFPYQSQANFSTCEPASQEASPIRKMFGKLKMGGESSTSMHKHSNSLATSMISSTSGLSSKSGSPKKVIKSLFTRSLFDQGKRLSFSHSATSPTASSHAPIRPSKASMFENNVSHFNFGAKNERHALDKFWEFEATDLDKSRVSSMPSAIIGEYDKEKWRTLKTLELEDE